MNEDALLYLLADMLQVNVRRIGKGFDICDSVKLPIFPGVPPVPVALASSSIATYEGIQANGDGAILAAHIKLSADLHLAILLDGSYTQGFLHVLDARKLSKGVTLPYHNWSRETFYTAISDAVIRTFVQASFSVPEWNLLDKGESCRAYITLRRKGFTSCSALDQSGLIPSAKRVKATC